MIGSGRPAGISADPNPIRRFVLGGALAILAPVVAGAGATTTDEAPVSERLAAASPERGRNVFRVCSACHTIDAGASHGIGPNLWAVIGRAVASAEGFDRYTPAMQSYGGTWSPERLDRYLRQPTAEVEGTAMVFPGIPGPGDRADLIAWLHVNSPAPADLASHSPVVAGGTAGKQDAGEDSGTPASAPDQPPSFGVLVDADGAEETHVYCTACHSERIVAQQGLVRSDWEELLEQMVEENGMNPIGEPDLGRILDYLAAHYGPDRPNFPGR